MNTIEIYGHQVPVTEDLEQAFWDYQDYCDLPLKVKLRRDPKCKEFQELYDSFRSAMRDAIYACEGLTLTEDQCDDLWERLAEEQDFLESFADQLLVVFGRRDGRMNQNFLSAVALCPGKKEITGISSEMLDYLTKKFGDEYSGAAMIWYLFCASKSQEKWIDSKVKELEAAK